MKQPLLNLSLCSALVLAAAAAHAEPAAAVFPGNEAVRIVNGKRVVEAPALPKGLVAGLKKGLVLPAPVPGVEVYMVEGPNGLMDCMNGALTTTGCIPSTLGTANKVLRIWTVKLGGSWVHCSSRAPGRKCATVFSGPPDFVPTVE